MLAAAQWVGASRDELNRINVFPVPDGDTGTNFWLTMRSIAEALHRLGDAPLPEVSRTAAQAAVMGSRGNSGMMLSHFLCGFDEGIGARFRIRAQELAVAIRRGFERLYASLEHPVEGTILTVCREAAAGAEVAAAPGSAEARSAVHELGGSLIVLRTADLLRVHVHLNDPAPLFTLAESWGEVLTRKAEDMREQHRLLSAETKPVTVVCDSSCDLPDELLDRHGIGLVALQLMYGDEVFQDRVGLDNQEFFRRLRAGLVATTSQPTVATFTEAYEHARAMADEVVVVLLSGALSGTYANAEAARRTFAAGGIHLVDSRSASLGVGLLALRGAELAEAGWPAADIAAELTRGRGQSGLFFTVDTLDNLIRSGRVSRVKGWLGSLLDFKPILALDAEGLVSPVDRVRGRAALLPKVLALLDEALPQRRARLRMGVVHADCANTARDVRDALHRRYHPFEIVVSPITAVLAAHTGPDAWGVIWQVEDGIPSRDPGEAGNKSRSGLL